MHKAAPPLRILQATMAMAMTAAMTAGCSTPSPEPHPTSRWNDLPVVLLSSEHPSATINFTVEFTTPVDATTTLVGFGQEGLANVVVTRNGRTVSSDTDPGFTCQQSDCIGDYSIDLEWGGGDGELELESEIRTEFEVVWPDYPEMLLRDPMVTNGTTIIGQGTVTDEVRDSVAVRAYEGLPDLSRFRVGILGEHNARIATPDEVYVPADGQSEQPFQMPKSCLEGPCGTAVTIEWNDSTDPSSGTFDWRLIDTNPSGPPVHAVRYGEEVIDAIQRLDVHFDDMTRDTTETTLEILIPEAMMAGAQLGRPVSIEISARPRTEHTPVSGIKLIVDDATGQSHWLEMNEENAFPVYQCEVDCDAKITLSARLTRPAEDKVDTTVTVRVRAVLPHLLEYPSEESIRLVQVP